MIALMANTFLTPHCLYFTECLIANTSPYYVTTVIQFPPSTRSLSTFCNLLSFLEIRKHQIKSGQACTNIAVCAWENHHDKSLNEKMFNSSFNI